MSTQHDRTNELIRQNRDEIVSNREGADRRVHVQLHNNGLSGKQSGNKCEPGWCRASSWPLTQSIIVPESSFSASCKAKGLKLAVVPTKHKQIKRVTYFPGDYNRLACPAKSRCLSWSFHFFRVIRYG